MTGEEQDSLKLEDMYRPPAGDDTARAPGHSPIQDFYVVSRTKFLVLFFCTFGAYQAFWFFANWRRYRDRTGNAVYPFWRAVFSPLFAHKLFALIAGHRPAGTPGLAPAPDWHPSAMATLYVILVLTSWVTDRIGDTVATDLLALAISLGAAHPLLIAQNAANIASGDPAGASNARMTGINYLFIVLGLLVWPLFVVGLSLPSTE